MAGASHFVWYELMTTDAPAARAFYSAVVGWTPVDAGMPGVDYTLLQAADTAVAGLFALPAEACAAGARPGWVGYVAVADVDAAAERLAAGGGQVMRAPEDIPGVGRFAVVADAQGAAFDLFCPLVDEAPADSTAPGHVGWHELSTDDHAAAMQWYATQFGWQALDLLDMGSAGSYQMFATGTGEAVGGMMTRLPETPGGPAWLYYFNVADVDAAMCTIGAQGGQVQFGPEQVPGGLWIVQGLDPQGGVFALVGPRAAA
ncbi:VOC family protein [Ideonella margarita]|uniref:VOC family protein n=1 Tax=Ideonella margarita TaxID=2984191 RepID=A0ABU9C332_9BURK